MNQLKPCGTEAAYYRHRRAGEEPCDECREAPRKARLRRLHGDKADWFGRWGGLNPSGTPFQVLDKLQIDGGWLTADQMAMELGGRLETVNRALYRLRERGLVKARRIELTWAGRNMAERVEWRAVTLPQHWGAA